MSTKRPGNGNSADPYKDVEFYETSRGDSVKICKYAIKRKLPSSASSSRAMVLSIARTRRNFKDSQPLPPPLISRNLPQQTKTSPLLLRFTYEAPTASVIFLFLRRIQSSFQRSFDKDVQYRHIETVMSIE